MKSIAKLRMLAREGRQDRVRRQVRGTNAKPRLTVFRSLRYTYAQLISDENGATIGSVSSRDLEVGEKSTRCKESAKLVGMKIAELAKEKNIEEAVFDRNGYVYHGRIAAVAEGAREGGLKL